jgi:hypothetical protein
MGPPAVTRWTDWARTFSESGRTIALLLAKSAAGARRVNFCVGSVRQEGVAIAAVEEPDARDEQHPEARVRPAHERPHRPAGRRGSAAEPETQAERGWRNLSWSKKATRWSRPRYLCTHELIWASRWWKPGVGQY